jgi:hypothetical protein
MDDAHSSERAGHRCSFEFNEKKCAALRVQQEEECAARRVRRALVYNRVPSVLETSFKFLKPLFKSFLIVDDLP